MKTQTTGRWQKMDRVALYQDATQYTLKTTTVQI